MRRVIPTAILATTLSLLAAPLHAHSGPHQLASHLAEHLAIALLLALPLLGALLWRGLTNRRRAVSGEG